ncbi:Unconventional prefoldin RPB5 interactor-like protein [Frankliniella fusca]|uniref:Unconventional prefoldin RPB5 interactor-like protein n=1 Tax=Frankliniella fusca TaxID=407009 RepID=A0AAE1HTD5_9NEOP|nr:Unconventional prefoldin RPB5 interactor-like protein [Frankliniella fusca]
MLLAVTISNMSLHHPSMSSNSSPFHPHMPDKETLWQQTYLEAFQKNYESVQRWTRWKEDHEAVKTALSSLPDKLSHEVVIPFGSKALVKAKLVHTNEILTSIGGSYFVKQSAKQGIDLCNRRISDSEEMLKKLEGERSLLSNRQTLPKLEEAFPNEDTKEIIEEYNEETEAEWRRQHRKKEAEYRKQLADLREKHRENPSIQTEEDIFRRLDELELEEELNDELERLHAEYEADYENNDEEDDGESSEGEETEDSDNGDSVKIMPNVTMQNDAFPKVEAEIDSISSSLDQREYTDEVHLSKSSKPLYLPSSSLTPLEAFGENPCGNFDSSKKNRRISFADESQQLTVLSKEETEEEKLDENIFIRFQHSEEALKPSSTKSNSSTGQDDAPLYLTPADIYNSYKSNLKSPPKSILKKSSSYPDKFQNQKRDKEIPTSVSFGGGFAFSSLEEDDNVLPTYQQARDISHLPPVLCDVQESGTKQQVAVAQESTQRPVSRFKQARQGGKKQ